VFPDGDRVLSVADPATVEEFGARPLARQSTRQTLDELARRVVDGRLDPHVRSVFPFDQAAEAIRTVECGHSEGKTVLAVTPE
jgi:NADPH:quinone reductase-like Zn-dependent oxidoreductase